jgi:hypothetical protein
MVTRSVVLFTVGSASVPAAMSMVESAAKIVTGPVEVTGPFTTTAPSTPPPVVVKLAPAPPIVREGNAARDSVSVTSPLNEGSPPPKLSESVPVPPEIFNVPASIEVYRTSTVFASTWMIVVPSWPGAVRPAELTKRTKVVLASTLRVSAPRLPPSSETVTFSPVKVSREAGANTPLQDLHVMTLHLFANLRRSLGLGYAGRAGGLQRLHSGIGLGLLGRGCSGHVRGGALDGRTDSAWFESQMGLSFLAKKEAK